MDRADMLRAVMNAVRTGNPPATTIYPAAAQRPPAYPADLPFIPDRNVSHTVMDDSAGLNWFMVREPDELLRELCELSEADGWEREQQYAPRELRFHSLTAHYDKDGWHRAITAVTSGMLRMVTLTQRPIT